MTQSPQGWHAWIVPSRGGSPQRLIPEASGQETDPSWSPDGRKIIFATGMLRGYPRESDVRILDLASHQITTLPGSAGMHSAHWSPDGQYIKARLRRQFHPLYLRYQDSALVNAVQRHLCLCHLVERQPLYLLLKIWGRPRHPSHPGCGWGSEGGCRFERISPHRNTRLMVRAGSHRRASDASGCIDQRCLCPDAGREVTVTRTYFLRDLYKL